MSLVTYIEEPPWGPDATEERRRIVDSVSWHVILNAWGWRYRRRPNGALVLLCPFHSERTPSGFFYPSGYFYCYGCHTTLDRVQFVQLILRCEAEPVTEDFFAKMLGSQMLGPRSSASGEQLAINFVPRS